MKTLFTLLSCVALLTLTTPSFGQVKIGVKGGMNLCTIHQNFDEAELEYETKIRPGFHLGVTIEKQLNEKIALQTGLMYSRKGFSVDMEEESEYDYEYKGYDRISLSYLEIPVHFAYRVTDMFQIYAGPYLALGIGGKEKYDYDVKDLLYDTDFVNRSGDNKFKPFLGKVSSSDLDKDEIGMRALDMGLDFGLGVEMDKVLVNVGYSFGLGNIVPQYESNKDYAKDRKMTNRVFSVSVSYFFK